MAGIGQKRASATQQLHPFHGLKISGSWRAHFDPDRVVSCMATNEDHIEKMRCSQCGHDYTEEDRHCRNCNCEFWCDWQSEWYVPYWTDVSMGRNKSARAAGSICMNLALALVLLAGVVYLFAAPDGDQILAFVLLSAFVIFNAHEVRAFTHGRTTSIDGWSSEAVPKNTALRIFGLTLDLFVLAGCLYFFFTKL